MARLLLLCLVLCCSLAITSAARNLLTSDSNSWLTADQSTPASSPSPSTPENGRDTTPVNEPSSGSRPAATTASTWLTETKKINGEVATAPSRSQEKSPAEEEGQQHEAPRSSTNAVGGDVILGGLATAFLAATVCYIRVTRRRDDVDEEKV